MLVLESPALLHPPMPDELRQKTPGLWVTRSKAGNCPGSLRTNLVLWTGLEARHRLTTKSQTCLRNGELRFLDDCWAPDMDCGPRPI